MILALLLILAMVSVGGVVAALYINTGGNRSLGSQSSSDAPGPADDCQISDWEDVGACDPESGKLAQTRKVQGPGCDPGLEESREVDCPVDCALSDWQPQGSCDNATGLIAQARTVLVRPLNEGQACGPTERAVACAVECQMSDWVDASACGKDGTKRQTRSVVVRPKNTSDECGPEEQTVDCPPPVDCQMSPWKASTPCGRDGKMRRTRAAIMEPANGGAPCGPTEETVACPAPVDCQLGPWTDLTSCGYDGKKRQRRDVKVHPANGGLDCDRTDQVVDCPAPVDCQVSDWRDTSACANGKKTQARTVTTQPANRGRACPHLQQAVECTVACKYSPWTSFDPTYNYACEADGTRKEVRKLLEGASSYCTDPLERRVSCPFDCVYSDWDNTQCDPNKNIRRMGRTIVHDAKNGGVPCDKTSLVTTTRCDCLFDQWKTDGDCTARGQNFFRRALSGPCGTETKTEPCKQDCSLTGWYTDNSCTTTPRPKQAIMKRYVDKPAFGGGAACPVVPMERVYDCPVDCVVSDWTPGICAGGKATDTRAIVTPPANGGKACPTDLSRTLPCNQDCVLGPWHEIPYDAVHLYGCGSKRDILKQSQGAGLRCPPDGSEGPNGLLQLRRCSSYDLPG